MWAEDRAATCVVRRPTGTLTGSAGALLAVRLGAATADLATRLGVVGAGPPTSQLGGHDLMEHSRVDGRGEQRVGELNTAHVLAGLVVEGRPRHPSGLLHED